MAWPTPQEYNEAIQNPSTAFVDPELRAGQPLLTPLGLPRPITGSFASVYQMVCANQRVWAVRCFLRDFSDHQERYAAISRHLSLVNLPYMVNFSFLADGIRVGGRLYPILKMEWVEGESFLAHVERNLRSPVLLLDLAQQWVEMAQTLASTGIAHGDLQHGNLIVVQGRLKLIDYDGMYVPSLAGRRSHEVGHRNYQHPQRDEAIFGPEVDHFSTWVIYSSLVALAVEPALWRQLRGGDECLIFRREDFLAPHHSTALAALEQTGDARLSRLADALRGLLTLAPDQIPPIDGQVDPNAMRSRPAAAWVRDHVGGAGTTASTAVPASRQVKPGNSAPPSWIEDFIGAPVTASGGVASYRRERTVAGASTVFLVAAWLLIDLGALGLAAPALLTAAVIAGNLGHLAVRYRRKPDVVARRALRGQMRTISQMERSTERSLAAAERNRLQIQRIYDQQAARIERMLTKEQQAEQRDIAAENERHQRRINAIQVQRHRRQQEETLTIQQIETKHREQIGDVDRQLAAIGQAETTARRKLLEERRRHFVTDFLSRQKIEKALIAGIGPGVKEKLKRHGIVRVTDVTAERLAGAPGIGAARADVLLTWRQRVESLAWQGAPTRLDRRDERDVRRHHAQLQERLSKDRERLERKLVKKVAAVREKSARYAARSAEEETQIEERHRNRVAEIRKTHRERIAALRNERTVVERQAAGSFIGVEQETSRLAKTMQQLDWERSALQAALARREGLSFPAYLRHTFLPR
ncbi:MAG: hypothetical protein R6W76_11195 [Caldilinea sp.]